MNNGWMGWDNGISGAYAYMSATEADANGHPLIKVGLMPTVKIGKDEYIDELEVAKLLIDLNPSMAGIEMGQKNPLFGVKGNFSNGYSYGVLRTVMRLNMTIPYTEINPKTWQKVIHKDIRNAEMSTKDASFEFCRRHFPWVSLVPARCKKPNDGIADALCIAEYLRRTHGNPLH